ncbi:MULTISPECIES: sensor histidine kinase [Nitrosopumilus]|uniref:sensor histidine kinase n=1 Tax=Nitrosopumilus TaxID=338191 RepID=UPI001E5729BA|nr:MULTISPECIES: sensor histidine kinase [Nitrosopumilus]
MKISVMIIAVMFVVSLIFTIVGIVTFELSADEIKKFLGSRNEGFAFNMMQDIDQHIENRISDFQKLTNLNLIHAALLESNEKFEKIEDIQAYLDLKEDEIEFTELSPFVGGVSDEVLTDELVNTIEFYREEYNYDVVEELFVTNAYGANVALGSGTSDYSQSDEKWWQTARDTGKYVGDVNYNKNYDSYSIDFAFSVNDIDENFIGVLRVVITLDDLLSTFIEDSEIITISEYNVLLLDRTGNSIYQNNQILRSNVPVEYFENISQGADVGFFELVDPVDDLQLVSYAKSTGYNTFEGFDWIVVVEQSSSSVVQELVELRNSILLVSILGMIASIIGGFFISTSVSLPLKRLTKIASSISNGDFDIKTTDSKIDEIKTISISFEKMAQNLKKLVETEKQLAEANMRVKHERLSAIGELAASMAHDMKNPLSTIQRSAEILQKNAKPDEELQKVIDRMNRAMDRITHQIDDVLNYVRITPLELKSIKITKLLESAKASMDIPKNISLFIPNSDIEIKCDVQKLEIVFINLFLNSIQAIGESKGEIKCKIEQKDSTVIIEIQDSGSGIPEDLFPKIFDPLVSSKQKGTGLGLSTCKNVIEQHKGTISYQNNPTRFTIIFPSSD